MSHRKNFGDNDKDRKGLKRVVLGSTGFSNISGWCSSENGRVEMWRSGLRFRLAVAAPFVWRCLNSLTITPFPHPAHQTGHADFPHPAFGQNITPSPTAHYAPGKIDARDVTSRRGTRQDKPCPHCV